MLKDSSNLLLINPKKLINYRLRTSEETFNKYFESVSYKYISTYVVNSKSGKKGRKPIILKNNLKNLLKNKKPDSDLEDIILGVSRLCWDTDKKRFKNDYRGGKLDYKTLLLCLSKLEEISSDILVDYLSLSKRHAQRYVRACKLCMSLAERILDKSLDTHEELVQDYYELSDQD